MISEKCASPASGDEIKDSQWINVWVTGFPELQTLNVRNVIGNSGKLMQALKDSKE